MADQVFVYITHKGGVVDDSALELLTAAKAIRPAAETVALVAGNGAELEQVCAEVGKSFSQVWKLAGEAFAYPNAEVIRKALTAILPKGAAMVLLHDTFGMDLSPGLSIKLDSTYVADVVGIEAVEGDKLKVVRQEYGGQVSSRSLCDMNNGIVVNVRSGCFAADETQAGGNAVVDKSAEAGDLSAAREFLELIVAEAGDVDITKEDVLVAVGRGIGDEENLEIADDLAEALGAAVCCSRPVVDAKWLEKSRQVGTSGQTVKPKVYLACGISGSFQHLGGIKGNPFIVAINKNLKAPIFQVADVGIVADIQDFLPQLTEAVNEG
ncbi:electron transfer flavoprotein subunit alpha/FixB family protein [Malonomonas rubra]|uniref:electron transfer flavoprotein subunit alpha/FixB family protein n=1 Tax=Malonomonas rubra TaxID=57040 RepID=UPI0026EA183D|nr:electron transfer flavoprotein subunit alpha/FixB family protein [Malonomonas rubra]